jgi:hypothetical protein
MSFDYDNIPDGWDPEAVIQRRILGQEVDADELEAASLILAARTLMSIGLTYEEATEFIDRHAVIMNVKWTDEKITYDFSFEPDESEDAEQ